MNNPQLNDHLYGQSGHYGPVGHSGVYEEELLEPFATIYTDSPEYVRYREILNACEDLAQLLITKNQDYGSANIDEYGELGIMVRLSDKLGRLRNLQNSNPYHESIADTYADIAGYAIIGLLKNTGRW